MIEYINNLEFECLHKSKGCDFVAKVRELVSHEVAKCEHRPEYKPAERCLVCADKIESDSHSCNNLAQLSCKDHLEHLLITENRIDDVAKFKKAYNTFACGLCANLSYDVQTCDTCSSFFCKPCIATHLNFKGNFCPTCWMPSKFCDLPRNIRHLLNSGFQIKCSKQCGTLSKYNDLIAHETACTHCKECRVKCDNCEEFITLKDKEASSHVCKP